MENKGIVLIAIIISIITLMNCVSASLVYGNPQTSSGSSKLTITNIYSNFTNFTQLLDTPASYTGEGGNCVKVNVGETGLTFDTCATGSEFAYNHTTIANAYTDAQIAAIPGNNASFNQSLTDTLYASKNFDYNETAIANAYTDSINVSLSGRIDSLPTGGNLSFNQSLTDLLYANIQFNYNQSSPFYTWLSTFVYNYNQTIPAMAYADSIASGNLSFNQTLTDSLYAGIQFNYNQSSPFYTWLSTFLYNYNQTSAANAYTDYQEVY